MKKAAGIGLAAIVCVIGIVALRVAPSGLSKPPELLGEWTTLTPPTPITSAKQAGNIPITTRLGFGEGGRELVVVWLIPPHHTRPLPLETHAQYKVQGATLIQSAPPRTNAFSGLGLATAQSSGRSTLTSHFEVRDNRLILSQPETGKSVTLRLTASAIPPGGPAGVPVGRH